MKRAFSLFEILVVLTIISILTIFILKNTNNTLDFTQKTKLKAELSLIQASLNKIKTSNTLLGSTSIISLDEANSEEENSLLFENILQTPLLSTTSGKKELGKWIKMQENRYKFYISKKINLEFKFEDNRFFCTSEKTLCKDFE